MDVSVLFVRIEIRKNFRSPLHSLWFSAANVWSSSLSIICILTNTLCFVDGADCVSSTASHGTAKHKERPLWRRKGYSLPILFSAFSENLGRTFIIPWACVCSSIISDYWPIRVVPFCRSRSAPLSLIPNNTSSTNSFIFSQVHSTALVPCNSRTHAAPTHPQWAHMQNTLERLTKQSHEIGLLIAHWFCVDH